MEIWNFIEIHDRKDTVDYNLHFGKSDGGYIIFWVEKKTECGS